MSLKLGSNDTTFSAGSSVVKQMLLGTSPKFAAPVLDHVPGAAAAYSLRRLSNAYAGPVVKVRRSSDSTTADFTAAEVVDGTLEAWVGAGDGFVHTWYDQSGNERNATQATDGYQPKLVSSGVVVTEGEKPAISFDGGSDCLGIESPPSIGNSADGALLFAIVCRLTDASVGRYAFQASDGAGISSGNTDYSLFFPVSGGHIFGSGVSSDAGAWLGFGSTSFVQKIVSGTLNATGATTGTKTAAINGGVYATSAYSAKASEAVLANIGSATNASVFFAGTISELLIYDSDVSASRELAEGEMAWHYGLQSKLPYNHAYAPQALGGASQTVPTDSDVLAFAAASGAKSIPDLNKIEDLVAYLKAQGLWNYARFYPMKSAQNAGTGSTVYGLGGLTSNNMTLVNSPTWGSDGVTFNGSTQCGRIADFLGSATLNAIWRGTNTGGGALDLPCLGQYDFGAVRRSHAITKTSSGSLRLARSSDGGNVENYHGSAFTSSEKIVFAEWVAGGGRSAFIDGVQESLTLSGGSDQSQRLNTPDDITVMSYLSSGSPSYFSPGTVVLAGFIETALTTTQRETITDLINAL